MSCDCCKLARVYPFPFTFADDLDTGVVVMPVSAGDVLLDYYATVAEPFDIGAPNGTVALFHSAGAMWQFLEGETSYPPLQMYDLADSSDGLRSYPAPFNGPFRQASQGAAASDLGGHVATVVSRPGLLFLRSAFGRTWAGGTTGAATLHVVAQLQEVCA